MSRMRLLALATVACAAMLMPAGTAYAAAEPSDVETGRMLFENSCSSCHGPSGEGTAIGPSLTDSGAAGADFMLRTGRMPLDDPRSQPVRKPPAFSDEEIGQITAFVASLGDGPEIPRVDIEAGALEHGQELFSENCAACHSSAGAGGAVGAGLEAPPLSSSSPVDIVEAMRIGPGAMPVFDESTLSEEEANSIARYLVYLRDLDDPGGLPLNRIGPIAEGFVAWLIGITLVLGVAWWMGEKE